MVNSEIVGLIDSYVLYGAESEYGTAVSTTNMFGGLIQTASFELDKSISEHAGMAGTGTADGRITAKFTGGTESYSGNVRFLAQEFDWLEYVLHGTKTGSGTVGAPFVYSVGKTRKPLTITENMDNDTDSERTFAGMLINNATISCSTGNPVECTVDMIGGKLSKDTSVSSAVAQSTSDLYSFSGGSIEMPNGTDIGNVIDSTEININNNGIVLFGFGATSAVNARLGKLNLSVKFTTKYLDDNQLDYFISQSEVTLALKFTRGTQYVDFVFSDVVINRISSSHNLNEFVVEESSLLPKNVVVTEVQSS